MIFNLILIKLKNIGGNADQCSHCRKQYGISLKTKNGTALWPSDSTSGNISQESKNTNSKDYIQLYVHSSIIYNSQDLEIAQSTHQ